MTKEFCILADSFQEAEGIAIEKCADDPEALMPHNMEVVTKTAKTLPDSYFD